MKKLMSLGLIAIIVMFFSGCEDVTNVAANDTGTADDSTSQIVQQGTITDGVPIGGWINEDEQILLIFDEQGYMTMRTFAPFEDDIVVNAPLAKEVWSLQLSTMSTRLTYQGIDYVSYEGAYIPTSWHNEQTPRNIALIGEWEMRKYVAYISGSSGGLYVVYDSTIQRDQLYLNNTGIFRLERGYIGYSPFDDDTTLAQGSWYSHQDTLYLKNENSSYIQAYTFSFDEDSLIMPHPKYPSEIYSWF